MPTTGYQRIQGKNYGATNFSDAITGTSAVFSGALESALNVLTLSGATTLTAAQTGTVVLAAAAGGTINLPAATGSGIHYPVITKGTTGIALQAHGTDRINISGSNSTAGGTQTSSTSVCQAHIVDAAAGQWLAISFNGTWTGA